MNQSEKFKNLSFIAGPGNLKIKVQTESFMYTIGYYEVPNLVTPKTDILQIDQFIHYKFVSVTILCNFLSR